MSGDTRAPLSSERDAEAAGRGGEPLVPLPVIAGPVSDVELADWGPLGEATGPEMSTSGLTLWSDGSRESGIWECTAGPSRWAFQTNEFIHLIAGSMTVTPDGEGSESVRLGPGDTALFPVGWSGTWDLHDTVRKIFVIF